MKKIVLMSVLAASMIFNAGCTDGEIAAGAIGVIIGIGLGDGHDHHHHNPPPYRRHWSAETSAVAAGSSNTAVAVSSTSDEDTRVAAFAMKYGISIEAATKVSAAFDGVQTEGLSSFSKIGLSRNDIQALMTHELPSSASVAAMASALDMSQGAVVDFLKAMSSEFQKQASDVKSDYWVSCMAKGSWKTPQNQMCKATYWPGCSPETGAQLCY